MVQEFEIPVLESFSPDICLVDQIGDIDLRIAYQTGTVSGDIDSVEGSFNGIDDPSTIIGSPDDIFAVDRASKAYKSVSKSKEVAPSTVSPE